MRWFEGLVGEAAAAMGNFVHKLRNLDAYPKVNEDFYSRTLSGGVITLVSSLVMLLLFFSEFSMSPSFSLSLSNPLIPFAADFGAYIDSNWIFWFICFQDFLGNEDISSFVQGFDSFLWIFGLCFALKNNAIKNTYLELLKWRKHFLGVVVVYSQSLLLKAVERGQYSVI